MKRLSALFPVLLLVAFPAFARVISYAPYTDRIAEPAFQDRTARHFVLLESEDQEDWEMGRKQVVLYDTAPGGAEPRVIYPQNGSTATIHSAALYQPGGNLAARPFDGDPIILLSLYGTVPQTLLSSDGGRTWREVVKLRGIPTSAGMPDRRDFGGFWAGGMNTSMQLGNDQWPFVLGTPSGVWAVAANGDAKVIDPTGMRVIGRDATGTRFITQYWAFNNVRGRQDYTTRLIDTVSGFSATLGSEWSVYADYYGWIAPDRTAFILTSRPEGRFLYKFFDGAMSFVRGRPGAAAPDMRADTWQREGDPDEFFAVPTHDYNGAWMIERRPATPTKLLRHTIQQGTREMWSDVTAPEVEALIPGKSGETVLIQVHRDRSAAQQVAFIDPALAVWRVGDPAPREYDELYLNEQENKGFVHIDVDTVAAGSPFVFNSGFTQQIESGPISPAPGGGDVIQEWGVVVGSLKQRLILPGVARLAGAFESQWRTDVTLYNPYDEPQAVEVRYVGLGEVTAAEVKTVTLTLQPKEVRLVPDTLHALFQIESGGGALHFLPAKSISVTGRTYSRKGNGTYGFGQIAIDWYNAAGPRFPLSFAGAFPGEHFRTNLLLTDTSGRGTEAVIEAYGVSGRMGTNGPILRAPANGGLQYNNLDDALGLLAHYDGGLVVKPTRGTVIAMLAAIDNRTNDPTYFPPDLAVRGVVRTIPVIGHLPGANGAQFRSDLYLYNPSEHTRTVFLEAQSWNDERALLRQFTMLPHEARVVPDVLKTLFNFEGLARLRYWTNEQASDGVRATSRAYTVEPSGATYGSLVPPLNNFQVAAPGDTLEILGAAAGPGFRTNIGLVELSPTGVNPTPVSVRIRLIDDQHRELDTFIVSIPRTGGMQVNDVFAARGITPPAAARVVVELLDGGLLGAYGSLTDNVTNDTTYCGAQLGAK